MPPNRLALLEIERRSAAVPAAATVVRFDGARPTHEDRAIAVEVPVNLVYGMVPYAVMMMTPADLDDFAIGFSLTEGLVAAPGDIRRVTVEEDENGLRLLIDLVPERLRGFLARRRTMAGRTSCGVCGIEDLAALPRSPRRGAGGPALRPEAIRRALGELGRHQHLNDATRAVHAAAWSMADGTIHATREDVGRHNALDKLIGALFADHVDPTAGFLLVTSRCSYEMVEKAAAFGAGALVAISAPTSLGIERARHHDMLLAGVARSDAMTIFSGAARLCLDEPVPA